MRIYWFYFLICLSTIFFSTIGILLTPIDWRGKIWAKIVQYWAKSILWIGNIPYTIIGLDKLDPNQQYVFASNHESAFDIPLTLAGIPWHVVPIAKKELKKIPFLSWAMLAAGHIFIDRSNHLKALQSIIMFLRSNQQDFTAPFDACYVNFTPSRNNPPFFVVVPA